MSAKIIRLWPVPVVLFCVYCLYTLVSDSYEVLYQEKDETDPLQFLACVELSRIYPNKTEIDLKELRDDIYHHFNTSEKYRDREESSKSFEEVILNRTKSGGYLVFNRRICLIVKNQKELRHIWFSLSIQCVLFAMKSDTFYFIQMEYPSDEIDQLIVVKKERPSDCDQSNGRFLCLNECFRRRFRLSRYFYQANETGRILLNFSESNQTIQESERICFGECTRENCKLVQLILVANSKEAKIFEAEPILSAFDFWVEIVGLIFSFVGLFFDQFASTATKLTKKLTRSRVRRRKVKVGLFYLNLTIILLSLAFCGYLCVRVALERQAEVNLQEREMSRNLIHPKTVHLAICLFIGEMKEFENKTMWEIERSTDRAFYDVLESIYIYITYGEKSFQTDYLVHRKILFKMFESIFGNVGRCFPLSLQPNYLTIASRPKLTVSIKKKVSYELYVLSEEENLNGRSFEYSGEFAFQKRIVKRLNERGGCVDYKYWNCRGKLNCLNRCMARKFIQRYNKTTFGSLDYRPVIDRDWFSPSEWNTFQMMRIPEENRSTYLNISRECLEEFPEKECEETTFEITVLINQPDRLIKEIDLQFDVVHSVEELPYSLRMALDLLGIQSIFFGFTLLQLFWRVYQFTKPRWRLKDKTDKVVWFIVCLLASIGCSWTTVRMLDVIVNGDLVPNEHYEVVERVQMPTMVFCRRIDQKLVDRNHQLTGRYLEELTNGMDARSTFESILYLNESNEWTPFDFRRVEQFFFLNMKCFTFHIDQTYDRNQFHFSGDTHILRVNFNEMKENELVYFMTQSRETAEFSKISDLDYSGVFEYVITHEPSLYEHEDRFGFLRRHFPPLPEDNVDDLRGQLLELQANEPQRRTLNLPVKKEHFGVKVDEDRFEQLHSIQRKRNPNKRTNLNYRQMFVTNHLIDDDFKFDFNFQLVFLRRITHSTNEVNNATLTLAVLNLLTLWLELGVLDLRPFLVRLDEHFLIYLYLHLPIILLRKLIKVLLFCCRWLKKFKQPLYDRINPQPILPPARVGRTRSAPMSRPAQPPSRLLASARPSTHQSPALLLQVLGENSNLHSMN